MLKRAGIISQFIRYGLIGLFSNCILYFGYLLFTAFGVGHKIAMTLIFIVGTSQTFIFNKRLAFRHTGLPVATFIKYIFVYLAAYLFNLASLILFVDFLDVSHKLVQGIVILLAAPLIFLILRYWVFRKASEIDENSI